MATSTIDIACVHPEVSKNTEMPQKTHLSHEMPRPLRVPATLGPNYLRYYRTYAYTYNIICNVLSGTVWHAVYRLRNVR